jgi:microcystin-dependent protein
MPDGSAAAPAYSNVNETASGWYRAGTQDWRLSINNTDVLQVTGTGSGPAVQGLNIAPGGSLYFSSVKFDQTAVAPPGTEVHYAGLVAPTGWLFEYGQTVSRTTYATLLAAISIAGTCNTHNSTTIDNISVTTPSGISDLRNLGLEGAFVECSGAGVGVTIVSVNSANSITVSGSISGTASVIALRILPYGQGDWNGTTATTFTIPDRRGRFIAGRDNMGGSAAGRLDGSVTGGINGIKLGGTGGEQGHALVTGELAAHNHTINISDGGHSHTYNDPNINGAGGTVTGGGTKGATASGTTSTATTGITATSVNTGSGTAHNTVPPAGISNMIIKT